MKVSGFTIIRRAIKFDFPVLEAINSILPLCNEFVVAVGNSDDGTLDLIRKIGDPKIRIIETIWDERLIGKGGSVLAAETNKALDAISDDADWAFYIQSDEVVHEKDLPTIYSAMEKWKENTQVDGLLFKYLHFYGSYDYLASSPHWYSREIRIIKNHRSVYSFSDAQGFRMGKNKKLRVKPVDAFIYHYGWVKHPITMQKKRLFHLKWQNEEVSKEEQNTRQFDYSKIDTLQLFKGTHPKVIQSRIEQKNWKFEYDIAFNRLSLKNRIKKAVKKYFGIELEYKNYRLI
ncbi:MAG: glycosyltransferase family 2 protein [Bacteroidetes bacterium]|nr:glycosyltransferase family 2 protein [Bacteroidota bacterium]